MTTCACCEEAILLKDAVVVGDEGEFEYWCASCADIWEQREDY